LSKASYDERARGAQISRPGPIKTSASESPCKGNVKSRHGEDRTPRFLFRSMALLKDVLLRAAHAADTIGAGGLLAHAKDDENRAFYEHFTFEASPRDPWHLLLMMKDLMQVESSGNPNAWSRYSSNSTTFATSPGSWFSSSSIALFGN